ncbi:UDP-N-acetylmuramoyl-tripeptide--D-alanyl-D-alanine ligase [Calderihabitans maritimus]|uniref:UDP-N-acetylmuramoyl-tripeptide--D-alanyl-D-alanine ligase n=1 Tax=Calderihabitans maritimus TaxID=1246530 RepID=A0A1Z5HRT2_9FIRM|nr:UDP-N-acetylmuramoyl-tripeptide--D-alanyl-D-alanine ligase [Calderihabitans maritimus]GAW92148.1 UDP-N-acetylmuramoylalanyl-D-glutamyl-2, 6-diaminopimelate--D-alanyl-D-alanine ligase [Calderihabitans maritimus]
MILMTFEEAYRVMRGKLLSGDPAAQFRGVSIDSRQIKPGELFFAFPGQRVDGHQFVVEALGKGAAGAVVMRKVHRWPQDKALILVDDTLKAFQSLSRYHRRQFEIPVIGVTGSNGKTTTKDMIASVLAESGPTLKNSANFNNEIGLPLTIFHLSYSHKATVLEMAMRGRGEIAELCYIAQPTGAVITNIGPAHYELLGSLENIARAKGELLEAIPPTGFAVLNGEDQWCIRLASRCRGKVLFYGRGDNADIRALDVRPVTGEGMAFTVRVGTDKESMFIPVLGEHNVLNALAAVGVGYQLGMSLQAIARGLKKVRLSPMRLEKFKGINDTMIINDAYNANPASTKASLKVLQHLRKTRAIAVLGNMLELGPLAEQGHREVGETVADLGIDYLFTVGDLAEKIARGALERGMPEEKIRVCRDNQEAWQGLQQLLRPGDVVLIKGSRGMKMEEIADRLRAE